MKINLGLQVIFQDSKLGISLKTKPKVIKSDLKNKF